MRILVTGDRDWRDAVRLKGGLLGVISQHVTRSRDVVVVHGDARGADTYAEVVCQIAGIATEAYPADWDQHGKAAGPIRNQKMLDTGIDVCVAFHDDLGSSRGTRDMVERCERAGIKVVLVGNDTR